MDPLGLIYLTVAPFCFDIWMRIKGDAKIKQIKDV